MYFTIPLPPFDLGAFHCRVTVDAPDVFRLNSRGIDGAVIAFKFNTLENGLFPTEFKAITL